MSTPPDQPPSDSAAPLRSVPPAGAYLYILRLTSGLLYIGVTTDLDSRWNEHVAGKGSHLTSKDPAQGIVYREQFESLGTARTRECQIKRWTRAKKEALVAGRLNTLRRLSHGP